MCIRDRSLSPPPRRISGDKVAFSGVRAADPVILGAIPKKNTVGPVGNGEGAGSVRADFVADHHVVVRVAAVYPDTACASGNKIAFAGTGPADGVLRFGARAAPMMFPPISNSPVLTSVTLIPSVTLPEMTLPSSSPPITTFVAMLTRIP